MSANDLTLEGPEGWLNLVFAVILFASPWMFGFSGEPLAAWTAWGTAVVIALLAIAWNVRFADWQAWASLIVGLWLIPSPWILGFANIPMAKWTQLVLGVLIVAVTALELWTIRDEKATKYI